MLVIEVARVVRVGYLQQNAFHKDDTYVPLEKQLKMMEVILYLNNRCQQVVAQGKPIRTIIETGIFDEVVKMNTIIRRLMQFVHLLTKEG